MAFSEVYKDYCDKSLKSELRTKLERVISMNAQMTKIINDFLQHIKNDTESVLIAEVTNTEEFLSLHKRLELAIAFFKDIHKNTQVLEDIGLCFHLEGIPKPVDMLEQSLQLKNLEKQGYMEYTLVKFVEDQSKFQKMLEHKMSLKYLTFEDAAQQRSSEIQSEMLKQKVKLINMEECLKKDIDKLSEELEQVKAYTSKIKEHMEFNSQCKHVSSTGICKPTQIVKSELEDEISKLKDDIMAIKCDMSEIMCKSSDELSQNGQLQIQQDAFGKISEDFDSFKEKFSNQVEILQEDINVLKKTKQKLKSKVLKLFKQINNSEETFNSNLSDLRQQLQESKARNDLEDVKTVVEGLKDRVDNNSYDIDKCWEKLNKRETEEDNLLAEVEALKYVQINDEKVTTETVIGQLNIGMEALAAQIEDVNARSAELCANFTRLQEAYNVLTADQETVTGKYDLTAAIMELGIKYELMKELVIRKIDGLEIVKRNLQTLNKTVISRKELEKEVTAIRTTLEYVQPFMRYDGKCHLEEPVESKHQEALPQDNEHASPTDMEIKLSTPPPIKFSFGCYSKPTKLRGCKKRTSQTKNSASVYKNVESFFFTKSPTKVETTDSTVFANSNTNWNNPLPTDTSLFQDSVLLPSLSVTVMGTNYPFMPVDGTDVDNRYSIKTSHQCITSMEEYKNESLEELRWKDYQYKKCVNS